MKTFINLYAKYWSFLKIDVLKEYGCNRIFSEKFSGRKYRRTELDKFLDYMRDGDTLVITELDD